jgi:hypothetical protein
VATSSHAGEPPMSSGRQALSERAPGNTDEVSRPWPTTGSSLCHQTYGRSSPTSWRDRRAQPLSSVADRSPRAVPVCRGPVHSIAGPPLPFLSFVGVRHAGGGGSPSGRDPLASPIAVGISVRARPADVLLHIVRSSAKACGGELLLQGAAAQSSPCPSFVAGKFYR